MQRGSASHSQPPSPNLQPSISKCNPPSQTIIASPTHPPKITVQLSHAPCCFANGLDVSSERIRPATHIYWFSWGTQLHVIVLRHVVQVLSRTPQFAYQPRVSRPTVRAVLSFPLPSAAGCVISYCLVCRMSLSLDHRTMHAERR